MVIYAILGYLIGFSIVVYWHFYKIEDYLENITKKLDKKHRITPDEWTISPEAEKMYNAALENMRGYHKKE